MHAVPTRLTAIATKNTITPEETAPSKIPAMTAPKIGCSWVFAFDSLLSEIKIRHSSPKTLKAYQGWTRQFQAFTKNKDYDLLSQQDVVDFLRF